MATPGGPASGDRPVAPPGQHPEPVARTALSLTPPGSSRPLSGPARPQRHDRYASFASAAAAALLRQVDTDFDEAGWLDPTHPLPVAALDPDHRPDLRPAVSELTDAGALEHARYITQVSTRGPLGSRASTIAAAQLGGCWLLQLPLRRRAALLADPDYVNDRVDAARSAARRHATGYSHVNRDYCPAPEWWADHTCPPQGKRPPGFLGPVRFNLLYGNAADVALGPAVMRSQTGTPLIRETARHVGHRPVDPVDLAMLMRRDHELTAAQLDVGVRPGAYLRTDPQVRAAAVADAAMVSPDHPLPALARTWLALPDTGIGAAERWAAAVGASLPA